MKITSVPNRFNRKYKHFYPTHEQWQEMLKEGTFRQASIHQTMGPNWRDIYWTPTNKHNQVGGRPTIYIKNSK
jgi:hypothetical protein